MRKMLVGIIVSMVTVNALYAQTSVIIEAFAVITTNASTNILVTLTPSNVLDDIVVEMRCHQGSGEANFLPDGNTTTNIRHSTSVVIQGKILSSVASNMIMEAKLGTNILATNIFSVIDTGKIGFAQARAIAEQALAGIIQPESGAPISVELTSGGEEYLVTFENIYEEDVLKGDFAAQVRIGSSSGSILGMERGP